MGIDRGLVVSDRPVGGRRVVDVGGRQHEAPDQPAADIDAGVTLVAVMAPWPEGARRVGCVWVDRRAFSVVRAGAERRLISEASIMVPRRTISPR